MCVCVCVCVCGGRVIWGHFIYQQVEWKGVNLAPIVRYLDGLDRLPQMCFPSICGCSYVCDSLYSHNSNNIYDQLISYALYDRVL